MASLPPKSLLHVFPSFAVGGSQRRFAQLLRAFGNRYNHQIISLDGGTDMAVHLPREAPVSYPLPVPPAAGLARLSDTRRLIARLEPDVLVTYNWGAIEWACANRFRPLVRHVHIEDGFGPEERTHQIPRRVWFRRLALSGRHTSIVLPSHNLLRIATEQWRLDHQVRYIANGIDCDRFRVAREAATSNQPLTVGTVATLRPEKNLTRLIASFAEAQRQRPDRRWRLVVVGDGPERAMLQQAAAQTPDPASIHFPGPTETPEQALAAIDIFALSSDTEQMPLGVLEAMASGLPVAATRVGDVAAMLAPENAPYVAALDDTDGLTRSLVALADNVQLRQRIGDANRAKVVADYDYRVMAERYAELFG